MDTLLRDIVFAARMLGRNRMMTAIAVLTLALGIGVNSAIFSVVNAVLLRPLPVREPDRLATVAMTNAKYNETGAQPGFGVYAKFKEHSRSFESMGAAASGAASIELGPVSQPVKFWRVSASFLPVLGVNPVLGRSFREDEDRPGAAKVAMLSNLAWRTMFAADPRVLGSTVKLDGEVYTVVGVLPPGFHVDGRPADVYAPIAMSANSPTYLGVDVYGRLKSGVTIAQATDDLAALMKPEPNAPFQWKPRVWKLRDFQVRDVRLNLLVLLGAVGLVLLIACANTASVLLARAKARAQEIAVREALGASRSRVVRQLLTESTLLALVGGLCGVAVAAAVVRLVPLIHHERLPGLLDQTRVDVSVLAFTFILSVITGVLFGMAPALASFSDNPHKTLKFGGRSGSGSRHRGFHVLIVSETALALVLAIGATLLIRTFFYLRDVAPGFRVDGLVIATVNSDRGKFSSPDQCITYYEALAGRVRRIPGVKTATFASNLPLTGELAAMGDSIEGHHFARPEDVPILWHRSVDTAYFRTMQIPLRRGRFFTERDTRTAPNVILVNEAFVRRFWPNQDAIGKHIGGGPNAREVIGVAGDVRSQDSTKEVMTELYFPYAQMPTARVTLAIRTDGNVYEKPLTIEPTLRRAIAEVDQHQSVTRVAEIQQVISDRIAPKRLAAQLIAVFAGLAVLLAAIGIYGVLSYSVAQRTHEIGIRMALGARRSAVLGMVVAQASRLAGIGILAGIVASVALTRIVKSLLYGVSATDPWIYGAVAFCTAMLSIVAAMVPAWRATRVDPVRALRTE